MEVTYNYKTSIKELSKNMSAASLIIEKLQAMGYRCNFQLQGSCLKCVENDVTYHQIKFHVDEIHRIDGGILKQNGYSIFALRHRHEKLKGIFVAI